MILHRLLLVKVEGVLWILILDLEGDRMVVSSSEQLDLTYLLEVSQILGEL